MLWVGKSDFIRSIRTWRSFHQRTNRIPVADVNRYFWNTRLRCCARMRSSSFIGATTDAKPAFKLHWEHPAMVGGVDFIRAEWLNPTSPLVFLVSPLRILMAPNHHKTSEFDEL